MMKHLARFLRPIAFGLCVAGAIALPRAILGAVYAERILHDDQAPPAGTALVFGAGLRRDGLPTTVLADRLRTAIALYRRGTVRRILLSGSKRSGNYNEALAMRSFALDAGVPDEDILIDENGDRTYLSCLRARELLGTGSILLVTQSYHLPRALLLCDALGLSAQGVSSDLRSYRASGFWRMRENFATLRALWDAGAHVLGLRWPAAVGLMPPKGAANES